VAPDRKRELCRKYLGSLVEPEQLGFLELLIDRRRVALLPEIASLFAEMVDDYQGIIRAQVRSAVPLTQEEQDRLSRALAAVFGGRPVLSLQVRPELIGGVSVRVKDALIDGSVRMSLNVLAADLRSVPLDLSTFEKSPEH